MDGDTSNALNISVTTSTERHQNTPPPSATASQPSRSFEPPGFSSDYTRKVDRTIDIAGKLPNAVFTLPGYLVQAIIGRADVENETRRALVVECKKFYLAHREYEENKVVFVDGAADNCTSVTLDCGRLYSEGFNLSGECGIGSTEMNVPGPRLVRIPPVLQVWFSYYRWVAKTTRGLFAWGDNGGVMGLDKGPDEECVRQPRKVPIDDDVLDVHLGPLSTFIKTDAGWLGCGMNSLGQLGLGHTDKVPTFVPVPVRERVTRWTGDEYLTFAWTDCGFMSCGKNIGQFGKNHADPYDGTNSVTTLTPVALPDDVKGRVDRVVSGPSFVFILSGRRCFGCGLNTTGQLGLGSDSTFIGTPTELPVAVDDLFIRFGVTVIRSGDTLLVCGENWGGLISTDEIEMLATPTPLDLPGSVVKVIVGWCSIFVQLTDGAWVGRGAYDDRTFIATGADAVNGNLRGWTPIKDEYAVGLSNTPAGDGVMILAGSDINE